MVVRLVERRAPRQTVAMNPVNADRVDLELMTLGYVDVAPAVLAGSGTSLHELIQVDGSVEDHVGHLAEDLPQSGWRLVHRSPGQDDWGGSEVFAAPRVGTPDGGWAMATLSARSGGSDWILSADPGPIRVFPGRAARRAGLSLTWPDNLTGEVGKMPELEIRCRNGTDKAWTNDRGDTAYVRGWLLDADGNPLEGSSWFAYGNGDTLPTLQPGEDVLLPVTMASYDYESLGPGRYEIAAVAVALDLRSAPGSIVMS